MVVSVIFEQFFYQNIHYPVVEEQHSSNLEAYTASVPLRQLVIHFVS